MFAFDSFRQGNSLCVRLPLALASRAVSGVHMLIAHIRTEDGCLNGIVPAGTLTQCWNVYPMQKCSSASLYLPLCEISLLLDIKEKNGEGGKTFSAHFKGECHGSVSVYFLFWEFKAENCGSRPEQQSF